MKYNFKPDPWQLKFLNTPGNKILNCGRQVGKSVICGRDGGDYALHNANKVVLMIAPTERQAYALFIKTRDYIESVDRHAIKQGKDRPTKTVMKLKNGTEVHCLPTGLDGRGIRFLTVDRLYADEASRIPEEVWTAVTPMGLTTAMDMILLSTPAGKDGYFFNCWENKDNAYKSFTRFSVTSYEVIAERKICETWTKLQRDKALEFLEQEKTKMTVLQYAQEYEGKFIDELRQFFPTELIRSCMKPRGGDTSAFLGSRRNSLGVDVAGMGRDETVLFSLNMNSRKYLAEIDKQVFKNQRTTDTVIDIKASDKKWKYKKMYIDDGGMGVGVFDPLLADRQTKRRVVAINNSSRSIDKHGRKKKLLKEDLYNNLLNLMERGMINLVESEDTFQSLKSIQAEYKDGRLYIFGRYTHITEALIRAAWIVKEKGLNIWIDYN